MSVTPTVTLLVLNFFGCSTILPVRTSSDEGKVDEQGARGVVIKGGEILCRPPVEALDVDLAGIPMFAA